MGFGSGRRPGYRHSDEGLDQPNRKPGARRRLMRCYPSRDDGRQAHGYPAPPGDGGKFGSTPHGFADVTQMVGGTGLDRNRLAMVRPESTYERPVREISTAADEGQVLYAVNVSRPFVGPGCSQ